MTNWTTTDIPSQKGRFAIVTGTGGLGYETALALAAAETEVVIAGRNEAKGNEAIRKIKAQYPSALVEYEKLDLASLASVFAFATRMAARKGALDILVNNAGIMAPPRRQTTEDGFELQFGTNYLGHFALTAKLLPMLKQADAARIVSVSSLYHRQGQIFFDDLHWQKQYKPGPAYGQSKLAMLMFAFELQRLSDANHWNLMSNAAHPGYARTELIPNGPGTKGLLYKINKFCQPYVSQSAANGALPLLFAATSPDAQCGGYYGPDWFYELKGPPVAAYVAPQAKDRDVARRLWEVSRELTGVDFT